MSTHTTGIRGLAAFAFSVFLAASSAGASCSLP